MPRLFTGLEVPEHIRFQLSLLRGGLPGARWIDPENYHLTLRFIGDVDHRTADEIAAALDRVDRHGFSLRLNGLNTFGGRKTHSIFAEVEASADLRELQAEHERIMQRLGLPAERRRFTPHITIARIRGGPDSFDIAKYLGTRGDFRTGSFDIEDFVLFSSKDSVGGGPYIVEAEYPLRADYRAYA